MDLQFYNQFKKFIPKGIYYEPAKDRWRVRLYKSGTVVFLNYYKNFNDAYAAYRKAKTLQAESTPTHIENMNLKTNSTPDLINSLLSM